MKRYMKFVTLWMALCCFFATPAWAYDYSMKVTVTIPKGAAAEKLPKYMPSSSKFTQCDPSKVDAVTIKLDYDAGNPADFLTMRDVYLLLFTPNEAVGDRFQVGYRSTANGTWQAFRSVATVEDLNALAQELIYLPKEVNPSGKVSETLIGSFLPLDGVPQGLWQIVGIVADRNKIDFTDTSTWDAWDVGTIVIGRPWLTGIWSKDVCQ